MTNNKSSLAGDASKLTFANLFSLIISLVSAMLLTRFRTTYEYGTYSQLLIAVGLAVTIFTLGLPNSINYYFAKAESKNAQKDFLYTYFSLATILSLIAGTVLVLSTPLLERYFHNDSLKLYSYILLILPTTRVIIESNSNMLIVVGKTSRLLIYSLSYNFSLLLIILIVKIFNLDFSIYMLLFIIVQVIFSLFVYYWAYESIKNNVDKSINIKEIILLIKRILTFSIPLGLGSMVSTISLELDKLMIGNLLGTESLAIYTNASKELPVVILVSSFSAVLMPKMSKMITQNKEKEAVALWGETVLIGFSAMFFFSIAIIAFAPQVITFLYSAKYIEGLYVFIIYTLVLILRSTYFGIYLNVSGNTKFVMYSSLASLVLNVILNYVFFKIFGFIGPALATFTCIFLVNTLQLYFSSKLTKISLKEIFPWKKILKIAFINLALSIPFILLKLILKLEITNLDVLISIFLGIIWLVVYILIQYKFFKEQWIKINNF